VPTTRAILGRLSRDELLGVLNAYELAVPDRRVKEQLVVPVVQHTNRGRSSLPLVWAFPPEGNT
jgi:hypothetical protein